MTLKLKRTPGLYLVGFMGSGKTTVGQSLAEELGWTFFDVDSEIERCEGKSVAEMFAEYGEIRFRDLESGMLQHLVSHVQSGHPCVIAAGGGAFGHRRNWEIIENNGVTVWLDCPIDTIEVRLGPADPTRPLSADRAAMRTLFEQRRPLYAQADFHVDANCDHPHEVMRQILHLPIF